MSAAQKAGVGLLVAVHAYFIIRFLFPAQMASTIARFSGQGPAAQAKRATVTRVVSDTTVVHTHTAGGIVHSEMTGRICVGKDAHAICPIGFTFDPANPYAVTVQRLPLLGGLIAGGPVHEISRDLFADVVALGYAGVGYVRMDVAVNCFEVSIAIDKPAEDFDPTDPLNLYDRTTLILPLDALTSTVACWRAVAGDRDEMNFDAELEALLRSQDAC